MPSESLPTVVLVHGAFADASGWRDVSRNLQARGYPCYAPANPLRGVSADADYLRSFLGTLEGPTVLVGHSYGGCVITNASAGAPGVRALVYVAAFAPDEGETLTECLGLGGGSTELASNLVLRPYPGAPEGDVDAYIDPAAFHQLFCADLDDDLAAFMALSQRAVAASCLGTPSGVPGWRTLPSWSLVAGADGAIPPEAERAMATRAGAHIVDVQSSHVAMISHPDETTELIVEACKATA